MSLGDVIRDRGDSREGRDEPEVTRGTVPRKWLIAHLKRIHAKGHFDEAVLRRSLSTTRRTDDGSLAVIAPGREEPVLNRTLRVPEIGTVLSRLRGLDGEQVLIGLKKQGTDRLFQIGTEDEKADPHILPIPSDQRPDEVWDREARHMRQVQEKAVPVALKDVTDLRDKLGATAEWMADQYPGDALPVYFNVQEGSVTIDATFTETRYEKPPQDLPDGLQEDPPDQPRFLRDDEEHMPVDPDDRERHTVQAGGSRTFKWPHLQGLNVEKISIQLQLLLDVLQTLPRGGEDSVHFGFTSEFRPRFTVEYEGYIWAMQAGTATE